MNSIRQLSLVASLLLVTGFVSAQDGDATAKLQKKLDTIRRFGWMSASAITDKLEQTDAEKFPSIQAFVKDIRAATKEIDVETPAHQWPDIDVDKLTTNNPNYWAAVYEVQPGDPAMFMLHGSLQLVGNEVVRASNTLLLGARSPKAGPLAKQLRAMYAETIRCRRQADVIIREGIKLHDGEDYDGATKIYRSVIDVFPSNGFAHYELGFSLRSQAMKQKKPTKGIDAPHFARARKHDPMQVIAYQGTFTRETLKQMTALRAKAHPAYQALIRTRLSQPLPEDLPLKLSTGCQEAGLHELTLLARQLVVAQRGRFDPSDHPVITKSLQALAPGETTEATLKRLAGANLVLLQFTKPGS